MRIPVSDVVLQQRVAEQTEAIREQTTVLRDIFKLLHDLVRPLRPQNPVVIPVGENLVADKLQYAVSLDPLPTPTDVVSRQLQVFLNGETSVNQERTAKPGEAFQNIEVDEGAAVKLVFTDVDDAGNRSPETVFEFTAVDEVPPNAPAGVSVRPVGETPEEAAPPADDDSRLGGTTGGSSP